MPRPIVLGVVGDSGVGKTTLTRGIARALGDEQVVRLSGDDYHRYERVERDQLGLSPLHPDANHIDVLTQHLLNLRRGEAILKPVYDHRDGTLRRPVYIRPARFLLAEGLLNFHTETLRTAHDVRIYLDPPEALRRSWKVRRDCTRRGYTTDQVLRALEQREEDAGRFIRPQQEHADIIVRFRPRNHADLLHLDAEVILRDTLPHPDLSPLLGDDLDGPTIVRRERDQIVWIPGDIAPGRAAELEETVWHRMSFANHLRAHRLGEFTLETELHRSDSLALVQLLVLYQLVWARAAVTSGGTPPRIEEWSPTGSDSALHV
jgi:phosphoribulokinase